uniref:NEDD4-binding protein 1 n=1 Tax=Fundulus heteroclitus TaxID=8078 RepID=A0A3Q2P9S1_FUNHE
SLSGSIWQAEAPTVDEFTVLEDKEEELNCARPRVEQVFKVTFTIIGLLDHTGQPHGSKTSRQIWLQLRGNRDDVSKAKEYVRGLCDPELQKEERYPTDMHCIFAGARGLFLDRLIRDTSAEVLVPEPGRLWLLGRAEPVVMAQSRVQQFVALFQKLPEQRQNLSPKFESWVFLACLEHKKRRLVCFIASQEVKRNVFFVSIQQDSFSFHPHTQANPALLPCMAEVDQDRSQSSTPVTELSNRILDTSFEERSVSAASGDAVLLNGTRPSHKRRSSESETRDTKRQYSLERKEESPERTARERPRDREARGPSGSCRSKTPSASSTLSSSYPGKANTVSAQPINRTAASAYQTIGHAGFQGGVARTPPTNDPPAPPVTGLARFNQSLRTPFTLNLPNEPGNPDLRHIIIDGSNVAMAHGLHRFFSCRGIALAVETFWRRGHREITVFVPQWRQKRDRLATEQHFLNQLEDLRLLSFTPSREVCGQRISSHDDRFLLHLAEKTDGIIVTNDNLRDFVDTSDTWRRIIQQRLLQFTFVEDHFMIPDDPLGKDGPHLDDFLRKENCKRSSVSSSLARRASASPPPLQPPDFRAAASQQQQPVAAQTFRNPASLMGPPAAHWPHSGPPEWHPPRRSPSPSPSPPPQRSAGETSELKRKLYDIFPDQKQRIDRILSDNPYMRDLNALSGLLLG